MEKSIIFRKQLRALKQLFVYLAISQLALVSSMATATQFSGVNNVQFHDSQYNKNFAGNGFLIEIENKLYAVTVKHVLFEAKTPEMKSITIADHVKEWRIHPIQLPQKYVRLGRLINADENEEINGEILKKDWLLFEVLENKSDLKVLKVRSSKVKENEQLVAFGCTYANQETCQQESYSGRFLEYEAHNLRIKMDSLQPSTLRGLSGSPVVDSNNEVVGIVSNVLKSKTGEGLDFAPASLDYLHEIINDHS